MYCPSSNTSGEAYHSMLTIFFKKNILAIQIFEYWHPQCNSLLKGIKHYLCLMIPIESSQIYITATKSSYSSESSRYSLVVLSGLFILRHRPQPLPLVPHMQLYTIICKISDKKSLMLYDITSTLNYGTQDQFTYEVPKFQVGSYSSSGR